MTPKEARKKICPMMTGRNPVDGNPGGVENCWVNRCAVWEVWATKESVYSEEKPDGDGWENTASRPATWHRTIPIEDQLGECGLITKWNE